MGYIANTHSMHKKWTLFMQLNSGQLDESYAGNDLRVEQAWMQGLTGCNTTVTIVDDGNHSLCN